jgi:hypothetical protein
MKTLGMVSITVLLSISIPLAALAGDFDGSKPLLCSVISVTEYTSEGGSQVVTPESVALPQFLRVDFDKMSVRPAMEKEGNRSSEIKRMERMGGKLILQGADEGIENVRDSVGWTAAISEETGKVVLTASGEGVAFVVFGACTTY